VADSICPLLAIGFDRADSLSACMAYPPPLPSGGHRRKRRALAGLGDNHLARPPASRVLKYRSDRSSAGDELNQHNGYGDNQQDVNESTQSVRSHQPQKPKHQKNDENGPKHQFLLAGALSARLACDGRIAVLLPRRAIFCMDSIKTGRMASRQDEFRRR